MKRPERSTTRAGGSAGASLEGSGWEEGGAEVEDERRRAEDSQGALRSAKAERSRRRGAAIAARIAATLHVGIEMQPPHQIWSWNLRDEKDERPGLTRVSPGYL